MFSSEGSSPSKVKDQLLNLGFKATKGNYDFVYEWDENNAGIEELIWFADKVHASLKEHNVYFTIETA